MRVALCAAALCIAAAPSPSWAAAKSARLLCTGYTGETNLTNFQALVKLSPQNDYSFAYADCEAENGGDLWFTDSSDNVIPHEIDTWTEDGDSFVWVKIPEVVTNGAASFPTAITMHWGDSSAKQTTDGSVWTGFAGVWHMNASGVTTESDATGNGLDGTPMGANPADNMPTAVGIVGTSRAPSSTECGLSIPAYCGKLTDPGRFTMSGWWKLTKWGTTYPRLLVNYTDPVMWSLNIYKNKGDTYIQGIKSGGSQLANDTAYTLRTDSFVNNWMYLTVVYDGTNVSFCSNGSFKKSFAFSASNSANDLGFGIGNAESGSGGWTGNYDEMRMYDGALSADRAAADYATMNSPQVFLTGDSTIVTATWTGGAGDGDIAKSANWNCYDSADNLKAGKVPTEATDVTVSGTGVKMSVPSGMTLTAKSVTIGDCTLGAALDWRGLGELVCADGATIDLNGNSLQIVGLGDAAMFTNSVDATTVDLDVTVNSATENSTTAIGGSIRFVKRGTAMFTSSKVQTYTGGTLIEAGTLAQPLGSSSDTYDETFTIFGTGRVTVNPGATYLTQSKTAYRNRIVLAGGTLQTSAHSTSYPAVWNVIESVTANSAITANRTMYIGDGTGDVLCDMGGNTLSIAIGAYAYLTLYQNFAEAPGKIVCSGSGYLQTTDTGFSVNATNIDFSVGSRLNPKDAECLNIHDYEATSTTANDAYGESGAKRWLRVHGTFTPTAALFLGCEMQDGSSIDLSAKTEPWSVQSIRKSLNVVSFADGAAVKILLGSRTIGKGEAIVSWTDATRPSNLASLKFAGVFDDKTVGLSKRSDGLYLAQGLTIVVR